VIELEHIILLPPSDLSYTKCFIYKMWTNGKIKDKTVRRKWLVAGQSITILHTTRNETIFYRHAQRGAVDSDVNSNRGPLATRDRVAGRPCCFSERWLHVWARVSVYAEQMSAHSFEHCVRDSSNLRTLIARKILSASWFLYVSTVRCIVLSICSWAVVIRNTGRQIIIRQ